MNSPELKYNHFIDFLAEMILKYQKQLLDQNNIAKENNEKMVKEDAPDD
jgi:hypothetical protein